MVNINARPNWPYLEWILQALSEGIVNDLADLIDANNPITSEISTLEPMPQLPDHGSIDDPIVIGNDWFTLPDVIEPKNEYRCPANDSDRNKPSHLSFESANKALKLIHETSKFSAYAYEEEDSSLFVDYSVYQSAFVNHREANHTLCAQPQYQHAAFLLTLDPESPEYSEIAKVCMGTVAEVLLTYQPSISDLYYDHQSKGVVIDENEMKSEIKDAFETFWDMWSIHYALFDVEGANGNDYKLRNGSPAHINYSTYCDALDNQRTAAEYYQKLLAIEESTRLDKDSWCNDPDFRMKPVQNESAIGSGIYTPAYYLSDEVGFSSRFQPQNEFILFSKQNYILHENDRLKPIYNWSTPDFMNPFSPNFQLDAKYAASDNYHTLDPKYSTLDADYTRFSGIFEIKTGREWVRYHPIPSQDMGDDDYSNHHHVHGHFDDNYSNDHGHHFDDNYSNDHGHFDDNYSNDHHGHGHFDDNYSNDHHVHGHFDDNYSNDHTTVIGKPKSAADGGEQKPSSPSRAPENLQPITCLNGHEFCNENSITGAMMRRHCPKTCKQIETPSTYFYGMFWCQFYEYDSPTMSPGEVTTTTLATGEPIEPTVEPSDPSRPSGLPIEPPTVGPIDPIVPTVGPSEPSDPSRPEVPDVPIAPTVEPPIVEPIDPIVPTVGPSEPSDPSRPGVPGVPIEPTVEPNEPPVEPNEPTTSHPDMNDPNGPDANTLSPEDGNDDDGIGVAATAIIVSTSAVGVVGAAFAGVRLIKKPAKAVIELSPDSRYVDTAFEADGEREVIIDVDSDMYIL